MQRTETRIQVRTGLNGSFVKMPSARLTEPCPDGGDGAQNDFFGEPVQVSQGNLSLNVTVKTISSFVFRTSQLAVPIPS